MINANCPYCGCAESRPIAEKIDWPSSMAYCRSSHWLHECQDCRLWYCRNLQEDFVQGLNRFFAESYNLIRKIDPDAEVAKHWASHRASHLGLKQRLRRNPLWPFLRDRVLKRPRDFGQDKGGQALSILFRRGLRSVLDVGCSFGGFVALAQRADFKAYGVEATDSVVERIRSHGVQSVEAGFFPQAHGPRKSYDAITMFHVLMHFPSLDQGIFQNIRDYLNPGGVFLLYCSDPDITTREELMPSLQAPTCMNVTSRAFLQRAAADAGYSDCSFEPCPSEPGNSFAILTR